MSAHRQAVLLCAEDDDLELVALVHLGRLRGLDLEVRPGVEIDDAPLLGALRETPQALLVLVRSPHLTAERSRELEATFERVRTPDQDLFAIRFERRLAGECLEAIAKQLERLGGVVEAEVSAPDASTGRLAKVGLPYAVEFDADFDVEIVEDALEIGRRTSAEFDVTVRTTAVDFEGEGTAAEALHAHTQAVAAPPLRRAAPLLLGVGAGGLVLALGALWHGVGSGAERAADPAPGAGAVEVEVIEAAVPPPAADEPWPPQEETPSIAPTPMADEAIVFTPDADAVEIVLEPPPPKRARKPRRGRR
jgi:hypothetical protein